MADLSDKQKAFVREYLKTLCATQAAINAGYSKKTAKQQGSRLLTYANISAAVERGRKRAEKRTEITLDRVLQELAAIAFVDPREAVKWGPKERKQKTRDGKIVLSNGVTILDSDDIPEDVARAISEVGNTKEGVKIKFHDKRAALVDLGKHLGLGEKTRDDAINNLADAFRKAGVVPESMPIATDKRGQK